MNQLIIRSFASALMVCFSLATFAQTIIKGKIKDESNKDPLIGANVTIKGTTVGTVTDYDGAFSIRANQPLPLTLVVSYLGYIEKEIEVTNLDKPLTIELAEDAVRIGGDGDLVITGQRISEKQKAAPLTMESLDLLAIKATPSDNFYDGLGSLKGVDLTAASLGFKVINTRGFNSTSPVRSLQIIDGVDNQAPGLNFSLGNFLGSSELDVLKVDLIVGASGAFYGPNAFNGVISMETKNPFYQKGFSASLKGGERNMADLAMRWADVVKNSSGEEVFGYKFNFSYLRANDWVADNYQAIFDGNSDENNPGGWDGINSYGDEYRSNMDLSTAAPWNFIGLGVFHRTGYNEIDLVDYGTRNLKASGAFHFRTNPEAKDASPEVIFSSNFGNGTTVYQGDNRFSLKDILFFQNRLEFRKKDKFFIRAYMTQSDAGNSYDPYFTALKLQEAAKSDREWGREYANWWQSNVDPQTEAMGYPQLGIIFNPDGSVSTSFDSTAASQWLIDNRDSLLSWHSQAAAIANLSSGTNSENFYEPGTARFNEKFNEITSKLANEEEGGTRFYDRSALYHVHGEYKFEPKWAEYLKVGANARLYTPASKGTVFYDTAGINIQNFEMGMYAGFEKKLLEDKLFTTKNEKD